ncbi:MAG: hypothetical protein ACU84H_10140 [Gammaproteobacteria bacterium]
MTFTNEVKFSCEIDRGAAHRVRRVSEMLPPSLRAFSPKYPIYGHITRFLIDCIEPIAALAGLIDQTTGLRGTGGKLPQFSRAVSRASGCSPG